MSQEDPAAPSAASVMATSSGEAKGKRPATSLPLPLATVPPAKKPKTGDTAPQASGLQLSRFQAVKKCLPSIKEQVSASTDLQWFGNSLVEKQLIGAQPKDTILHAVGVSNERKVGQLMQSVITQIKNNPVKYGRFVAVLRQEPVLTSLAERIKAEEKTLKSQLAEGQTGRRLSTGAELGTSSAVKTTEVKRRLSLESHSSDLSSTTGQNRAASDKPRAKRRKCGECPGCLTKSDCGECTYCKTKMKYGGPGNPRKPCIHRQCEVLTKVGDQPHPPTNKDNHAQARTDTPQLIPSSSEMTPTLTTGVGPTIQPQPKGVVQQQASVIVVGSQVQALERGASAAIASPREQRVELTTSTAITPSAVGSSTPKGVSQPKVNTAPTIPQEQVQMQSSSPKVKRSSSTSSDDDRKRVRFCPLQGKTGLLTSSATTPTTPTGVPRPKGATQEVKIERTEKGQKPLCGECPTLKSTIAILDQNLKQKDKQLQTVVSYCEGQQAQLQQLKAKTQELEKQLAQEIHRVQQSLVEKEKELQTQEQTFKAKELDYEQKLSSLSQQLTQAQMKAQRAQKQLQRRNQAITAFQKQWKEIEAEDGHAPVTTQ